MIQKAIAFSLWGRDPRYVVGMINNAIIAPHVFEDWQVVVYHDRSVSLDVMSKLERMGCLLIDASDLPFTGYFWRFLINDIAERWIVRDSDSRLNVRDLTAVEEWIKSGKKWHVIKDDPAHTQKMVISGGWGGYQTGVNMRDLVEWCEKEGKYGDDEDWIQETLFPQYMQSDCLIHDYRTNPIPRKRIGHYYVVQVWDENEQRW